MNSRRAIYICVLLEFFIVAGAVIADGFTLTTLQTLTRFSGRLSLLIFSFIFLFSRTATLSQQTSGNPYLVFAIAHGIHLVELLLYVYRSGTVLVPFRLVGGFLAYILIFAMPILAHRYNTQRISAKVFFRAEIFYLVYVLFIFFMTYFTRVKGLVPNAGGSHTEHVIGIVWVLSLPVVKLILFVRSRVGVIKRQLLNKSNNKSTLP